MPAPLQFPLLRREIAGVSVAEIVRQFGSPVYVYDGAKVIERINDLKQFETIRYAQKACSNLAILDLVRRHGVLVDAVSCGEIRRAMAAGYSPQGNPPPIVYTADIFDHETLDLVIKLGLHVNCGSPDMVEQLGARAPGAAITLRVNPGFGHGHSQKTNTGGEQSKHGIWHGDLEHVLYRADALGLAVTGLHVHIGSGTDFEHLSEVCGAVEKLALSVGRTLTTISAGGGLPVPYRAGEAFIDIDKYFRLWDATRKSLEGSFGHPVHLELEPGRYLVCESGFLVAEIRAIKRMGSHTYYLLNAGFNNLARPILYGAYHPMSIVHTRSEGSVSDLADVVVGGPLCESGDIFTQEEGGFVKTRSLPKASVGDLLVIENAGAYGFAMSSNYNSMPLAAEVLVQNRIPTLIRKRQSFEDLIQGEVIPPAR